MHPFRSAVETGEVERVLDLVSPNVEGASDHALVFRARVGDRELHGCDFIHVDEDGLIDEFTVMVRPLSAALALAEAMKAELA